MRKTKLFPKEVAAFLEVRHATIHYHTGCWETVSSGEFSFSYETGNSENSFELRVIRFEDYCFITDRDICKPCTEILKRYKRHVPEPEE